MHRIRILIEAAKVLTIFSIIFYTMLLFHSLHLQGFELSVYNTNSYFLQGQYFKSLAGLIGVVACVVIIVYLIKNPSGVKEDDSLMTVLLAGVVTGLGTIMVVSMLAHLPTTRFEVVRSYNNPVMLQTSLKMLKLQDPISYSRGRVQITDQEIEARYDDRIKDKYVRMQSRTLKNGELISRLQAEHLLVGDQKPFLDLRNLNVGEMWGKISFLAYCLMLTFMWEIIFVKPKDETLPT